MEAVVEVISNKSRWWSGKAGFDYEESSTENDDFTARVASIVAELSANVTEEGPIGAVLRGLKYIFGQILHEENFEQFGADALQTFQDAATTADEPIRKYALLLTEVTAQLWMNKYSMYKPKEEEPSTDEVLDFVMGIYALERIGIAHDSKEEIRTIARSFSVSDLFGCEYKVFRQPAASFRASSLPMEWRDYTNALTYSFYAVKTGIDLHLDLTTVVKLLPAYRPYQTFAKVDKDDNFDDYADQLTMVFNLVHVLSNYGEFEISPSLLPLEYAFLMSDSHVVRGIEFKDIHLLGEIVHCLRVFGVSDTSPSMTRALAYLTKAQFKDGSWPARDDADDAYFRYHAAMCAVSALYPRKFRGFGPCEAKLFRLLQSMKYSTRDGVREVKEGRGEGGTGGIDLAESMQRRLGRQSDEVRAIRALYEAQSLCISHELPASAELYGMCRLYELGRPERTRVTKVGEGGVQAVRKTGGGVGTKQPKKKRRTDAVDVAWRPSK